MGIAYMEVGMSEPAPPDASVREEHFENDATGVEVESTPDDRSIERPWDPDQIRVSTKNFSLRNVFDMVEEKDLELAPDFQRSRVWRHDQKSKLIESILLQIPLPTFYFAQDRNGKMRVVDGLQRLSTALEFARPQDGNRLRLKGLEYLTDQEGAGYEDLPPMWRRRFNNTQIVVHVIDPETPAEVTYDIFRRINTGGTPLNAQEIRHCMSHDRSREFLRSCADLDEFDWATGGALRNHIRMADREVVLRYCAFRILGVAAYQKEGPMDAFLWKATEHLDDPALVPDDRLELLREDFRRAMENAYTVFGEHAFRKWPYGVEARNPINRPLFESWAIALTDIPADQIAKRAGRIVGVARSLMSDNVDYIDAITTSTGDHRKVAFRFASAESAIQ